MRWPALGRGDGEAGERDMTPEVWLVMAAKDGAVLLGDSLYIWGIYPKWDDADYHRHRLIEDKVEVLVRKGTIQIDYHRIA